MNQTKDCYRGALVGAAIGDALGATVDGLSKSELKARHGFHREIIGGGALNLSPGEVSGDTQLAVAVAESIVEKEATDPRDITKKLLEAYAALADGCGLGPTTRSVLDVLKPRAKDIFSASRKVWQAKNDGAGAGCIVRVAPVGLFRRVQPQELVNETIAVCRLTHFDQRCVDACLAYNFGISYLTSGKDVSKLLFKTWRFLMDARGSREYRELLGEDEPAQDMVKGLKQVNDLMYDDLRANGQAIETTQAAYWLVLNAIDFEEGVARAVNLGGDAATLGAVVGGLLGARFGEQAIPERWTGLVKMRQRLETVADRLCRLGEPKK